MPNIFSPLTHLSNFQTKKIYFVSERIVSSLRQFLFEVDLSFVRATLGKFKMKTFQIFLLFSFSFSFSIQSLNGLGVSNDGNEGFFQHVFYEVLDTNGEHEVEGDRNDHEAASISLGDEVRILDNSIGLKSAKVISPTLFDSPPPFKEYARMARYVVHHSGYDTHFFCYINNSFII